MTTDYFMWLLRLKNVDRNWTKVIIINEIKLLSSIKVGPNIVYFSDAKARVGCGKQWEATAPIHP